MPYFGVFFVFYIYLGEDRWLCTLMLKQGYKVEYVAASDALTYAPEGFYEFYNQRRRWSPSTIANILDLILDWKNVTKKNGDISKLYIVYQMFLMICSTLTPGTIFLMILGSIHMAFPAIPPFAAMLVNLFPVAGMLILCFVAKPNTQVRILCKPIECLSIPYPHLMWSKISSPVLVGLRCCCFHALLPADDDSTGGHSGGGRDSRILFRYHCLSFVCCRNFLYLSMSSSAGYSIKDQSQNLEYVNVKHKACLKTTLFNFNCYRSLLVFSMDFYISCAFHRCPCCL